MSSEGNRDLAAEVDALREEQDWLTRSFMALLDALEMNEQGTSSPAVTPRSHGLSATPLLRTIAEMREKRANDSV